MELIVSLIAGIIGGNAAGAALRPVNLGIRGNSLAGVAGGFVAGQLALQAVTGISNTSAANVMAVLVAAAIGGFCVTLLAGLFRRAASRR